MPVVNYDWDELEDNIVEEYDDAGATIADYTSEPDHFGNVISQHRSGQNSFFHYDGLGSTLAVTDGSQNVTDTRAYSAFGETTESTGSTTFPFEYVGEMAYYRESLTGQYMARTRPYEPIRARWLCVDPDAAKNANVYMYADNTPLREVDPSGLYSEVAIIGVAAPSDEVSNPQQLAWYIPADDRIYLEWLRQLRQWIEDRTRGFSAYGACFSISADIELGPLRAYAVAGDCPVGIRLLTAAMRNLLDSAERIPISHVPIAHKDRCPPKCPCVITQESSETLGSRELPVGTETIWYRFALARPRVSRQPRPGYAGPCFVLLTRPAEFLFKIRSGECRGKVKDRPQYPFPPERERRYPRPPWEPPPDRPGPLA